MCALLSLFRHYSVRDNSCRVAFPSGEIGPIRSWRPPGPSLRRHPLWDTEVLALVPAYRKRGAHFWTPLNQPAVPANLPI